ncbi:MAG: superoxide dismutase family protein [Steroidobacter sp.]
MRRMVMTVILTTAAAMVFAQTERPPSSSGDTRQSNAAEPPPEGQTPVGAAAKLEPRSGSQASGELMVGPERKIVRITGVVKGLEPNSEHGFHIHERGDCSAPDASSAGGHFNPAGAKHGAPDSASKHGGDMLNIRANADGVANVDVRATGATLRTGQSTDILNKAIVIHAKPDDYKTQPSGDSGDRIACGVIQ